MKRIVIGLVCLLLSAADTFSAHWTVNPYAFQYDMSVYITLQRNGKTVNDYSDFEIGAFCGDECRGVAKKMVATNGTKYLYLRIRSNQSQGETIQFKVYRASYNIESRLPESLTFEAETMRGSPSEPMVLTSNYELLGDVNDNGEIDIGDAVSIVNYLVGKPSTVFIEKAADTNKNGKIDIGDAVTIVNYLVGKTASLSRSTETTTDGEKEPQ